MGSPPTEEQRHNKNHDSRDQVHGSEAVKVGYESEKHGSARHSHIKKSQIQADGKSFVFLTHDINDVSAQGGEDKPLPQAAYYSR
jgi:hypothetical protein